MTQTTTIVTAAALVIGDEILSGRTKDKNIGSIADFCTTIGIDLREVRIVPDVTEEIVAAVNALRVRYDYVFTTGGIGPTHDDITADAIAAALDVEISEHPQAIELLLQFIKPENLNEARRRMARIPHGAELILNKVSKAPGFWIENVIVMAGVPSVMQAMLEDVGPRLSTGTLTVAETIEVGDMPEGAYAAELAAVALQNPELSIGSYPSIADGKFRNQIVVRGKKAELVAEAVKAISAFVSRLHTERV
jgi:molybdenum cofactor synthesis domain-containing protein